MSYIVKYLHNKHNCYLGDRNQGWSNDSEKARRFKFYANAEDSLIRHFEACGDELLPRYGGENAYCIVEVEEPATQSGIELLDRALKEMRRIRDIDAKYADVNAVHGQRGYVEDCFRIADDAMVAAVELIRYNALGRA